jgi:dolichol-phosphate mannosyltransferase
MTPNLQATPSVLELAVIVPTFKERANVFPVLEALDRCLKGMAYEVIFVDDDSPDGTAALVRKIAWTNPRVRVLQRIGRRGLASACLEGMMATPAPYIAVMDGDLQHDEGILPAMLEKIRNEKLDLVVATRNAEGGGMGEFSKSRVWLSNLGRRLSQSVSHTDLSDPMSGFFMLDRRFLEEVVHSASGVGFKILLDLVASARRPVRFGEVPYTFRKRIHGTSKLDILVGLEYLQLLLDKAVGDLIPPRFIIFSMVGAGGLVLSLGCLLYLLLSFGKMEFLTAQAITTFVAMTANFFLNNSMTYRNRRLRGRRLWIGLATFYAACFVGAVINLRVAEFIKDAGSSRYLAAACGLTVGAVWNYAVTSIITWRQVRELQVAPLPQTEELLSSKSGA